MNSESLLNAIFAKDGEAASDAFQGALASKLANALEVKKVEIASNLISAPPAVDYSSVEQPEMPMETPAEAPVEYAEEVPTETVDATE